ncbi:hypothetical protein RJT34_02839 [Clitoria ternatea]|uniref:Uncharacterized protein n=1 Tax=Clitoria ternatea TaxID=43366 RepID=A0AAN9Q0N0_CLITE
MTKLRIHINPYPFYHHQVMNSGFPFQCSPLCSLSLSLSRSLTHTLHLLFMSSERRSNSLILSSRLQNRAVRNMVVEFL